MNEKQCAEKLVEQTLNTIKGGNIEVTREIIRETCSLHFMALKLMHPDLSEDSIDLDRICERIHSKNSAGTTISTMMDFIDTNHQEWLDRKREKINEGIHWRAFKAYMSRKLSEEQITELDNSTDKILGKIEDPERAGSWQSRGLVIGDVQSGKTTNFIALANKAIDAGYKVVVVLSGLHNNLRRQTQIRFEEGVSGWKTVTQTRGSNFCGIADLPPDGISPEMLRINHLTSSEDRDT